MLQPRVSSFTVLDTITFTEIYVIMDSWGEKKPNGCDALQSSPQACVETEAINLQVLILMPFQLTLLLQSAILYISKCNKFNFLKVVSHLNYFSSGSRVSVLFFIKRRIQNSRGLGPLVWCCFLSWFFQRNTIFLHAVC